MKEGKNLVIVESPAKAGTIQKFLGEGFIVKSSFGHIRDLSDNELSIDIQGGFKPEYVIPADKKKVVSDLKKAAKEADTVWLASDEDREGEAISWHLFETLGLKEENTKRIVFHEITRNAILNAIENPREIDMNLVDAQQARRVLDRLVGFELSPVLWRKIQPKLSAGRVQSVALRLVVDRAREILGFKNEQFYRVDALFHPEGTPENTLVKATLDTRFPDMESARAFLEKCIGATFSISSIDKKEGTRTPAAPFTTSTLQQEAARKIGLSVSQTMSIAQKLYEQGLITYMRTDSTNLSSLAINTAKQFISNNFGEEYSCVRNKWGKAKGAQEAHEAIRPTYMSNETISGSAQEQKLYELIWKRTIASQMADAELEKTTATISISNSDEVFVATGEVITFDGFLRVYKESYDDENEQEDEGRLLPPLSVGQVLEKAHVSATQRFTMCPLRYTEASLVRKLEELGIGRPSTYAPTISTVQQRGYVEKGNKEGVKRSYDILTLKGSKIVETTKSEMTGNEKAKLLPTDVGIVVNDFLMEYFPEIMDYNFTASVEKEFDEVAEGKKEWAGMMADFYEDFHPMVEKTIQTKTEHKVGERMLGNDPISGKPVSSRYAKNASSKYPISSNIDFLYIAAPAHDAKILQSLS